MPPLRLIVYDATDTGPLAIPRVERAPDGTAHGTGGLTRWWRLGAAMHRGLARADGVLAATNWREALAWAVAEADRRGARIRELQAWGHGGWGYMGMGGTRLDAESIAAGGSLAAAIDPFARALAPDALVWLRCCSAFGHHGRDFAPRFADRIGARVAGHTHIIGVWQSGTHSLAPGDRATWDPDEGVDFVDGTARAARDSSASAPRTIGCLRLGLPEGW
jgi:hypothetical protein